MSGELGVKAFKFGLDKGYDRIPNTIFLTPKERKERKQQQQRVQQQQGYGPGQDQYNQGQQSPQPQPGQGYSQPGGGYNQDSYSQDRGGYASQVGPREGLEDAAYWNPDAQAERGPPMQADSYYPPGGGSRRSYNPTDYEPRYNDDGDGYGRDQYGMGSGRDQYRSASAGRVDRYRPQSYQGGNYANSYDDYDDEYDRRDSRRSRSSKTKSTRSRSRSGIRGQLDKRFDKTERGLTSGALGALAGGLVGHEVGKGPLATVAGVVLGGLGANAFEARQERQKGREAQSYGGRRAKSTDARGGGYEKEEYYGRSRGSRGGDRDRGYDEYDSYSDEDDDRSPQRATGSDRKDRRQSKRAKDDEREEMEKHFGWAHTLRS